MPRLLKIAPPKKTIWNLERNILNPLDIHTSYFKSDNNHTDNENVSNLSKTVTEIIKLFK